MVATAVAYLLAKGGLHVDSQGTSILAVLMFGAGTDYCLLLVSRYREELRSAGGQAPGDGARGPPRRPRDPRQRHDGRRRAARRCSSPTSARRAASDRSRAIGVFTVMVGSLTLLPALLVIFGRRGFWPRRPADRLRPRRTQIEERSLWRRFGLRVVERPALALARLLGAARRPLPRAPHLRGRLQHQLVLPRQARVGARASRSWAARSPPASSTRRRCSCERTDGPVTQADTAAAADDRRGRRRRRGGRTRSTSPRTGRSPGAGDRLRGRPVRDRRRSS